MNRNIKTKKMILNSILIALGFLLHQITPAIGLPMQPDFSLILLFVIIIINRDYKVTVLSALIMGIFTAMTTKFPGGQIPNIIDKLVTANIMFGILLLFKNKVTDTFKMLVCLSLGTIISGMVFLTMASILVGLPSGFINLIKIIVIPTTFMNLILGMILHRAIQRAFKITRVEVY